MVLLLLKESGLTRRGSKFGARGHKYRRTRRILDQGNKRDSVVFCSTINLFPSITKNE